MARNSPGERRKARGQSPLTPVDFSPEPAFHTPRLNPLAALLLLTACATAPLEIEGSRGFSWGFFDGAVAPIAFIVGWFSDSVGIYGIPNSGGWYDFGFLLA